MDVFYFTMITRKRVRVVVSGVLADGGSPTVDDVDVALLPLTAKPDGETAWTDITLASGVITPLIAAPDATQTGALSLPVTGARLWVKVVDDDEVDAVPVAEFRI